MSKRQIRLGAFVPGTSQHVAGWRHPQARPQDSHNLNYFIELAKTAERGLFDAYFLADVPVTVDPDTTPNLGLTGGFSAGLEPVSLFSALAAVTQNIGFIATASTTYEEPYSLARKFASLDHLSEGRAAWNVVTTAGAHVAKNFGLNDAPHPKERYERADEFIEVAQKLWDSWEDDAFEYNKETGQFFDGDKLHPPRFKGKHLAVHGGLNVARSPQGYPVIVQAGQSEDGRELAAKFAEVIFTAQQKLEDAQAFYRDVKGRLAKYGRHADDLKIMPGVSIFVGKTEEEARAKYDELNSYIHPTLGLSLIQQLGGFTEDLSKFDLDQPLPEHIGQIENGASRNQLILEIARKNNFTIRELYQWVASARGHWTIIGTPEQVVDELQAWFENEAADGFNILPPTTPASLDDFVDLVVPELQRRGLFRTEYEGKTLRENLGLKRPENQYVLEKRHTAQAS